MTPDHDDLARRVRALEEHSNLRERVRQLEEANASGQRYFDEIISVLEGMGDQFDELKDAVTRLLKES